jgi:urease accessory protein
MHELNQLVTKNTAADTSLTLPFEQRQRSRLRVSLDNGEEAGLYLERGTILRGGDQLQSDDGFIVEIKSAAETVSTVYCSEPRALVRAAYHLGNRHVALQIGAGWVRYLHDHVLDTMVRGLDLEVTQEEAPFEPEAGAYHSHENDHGHSHAHG